ncbi:hypothetical protein GP486_007335 [Trichoglossum hirsutum]|uniref:Uncharacterized protein n=1 Tax=Trichoglossum hirsutum TaxID=265104 RepID=A0A9P8IG02_9PEZI|nr:hypothetical protein GP486_007335 [Trichoglossum hirsutum]
MSSPDSLLGESPPPVPTTEGFADEMFSDSEAEARAGVISQAELMGSDVESDGEDEDIAPSSRRKGGAGSRGNIDGDDVDQAAEDEGLFGSDDDGDRDDAGETPPRHRSLDDSELDSGDDEDRRDRAARVDGEVEQEEESATIQDVQLGRHPVPEGSDGEVRMLDMSLHFA